MSYAILHTLGKNSGKICKTGGYYTSFFHGFPTLLNKSFAASYSRRSDSKNIDSAFKSVKSKIRRREKEEFLGLECAPNWEILSPRSNRFYLPNAIGPAWQGASTIIKLNAPLELLIDFEEKAAAETAKLKFAVSACPTLIKKSLHELFPTSEIISSEKLAIITLSYKGDIELGARKFVLASREITARLHRHGFWADFINPFSGKPFYAWANNQNLYQIDERFRGLNMKITEKNHCVIIISDDDEHNFSGIIYTNTPADYLRVKTIIDTKLKH